MKKPLIALFLTTGLLFGCTSGKTGHPAEGEAEAEGSEAESEGEGDQPCPEEGCSTNIVCVDPARDCPQDNPCRIYSCNAGGYCAYTLPDEDEDGYVRQSCGGGDCNDLPARWDGMDYCDADHPNDPVCGGYFIHPGMEERCDGLDNNCNGQVDEVPQIGMPCDGSDEDICNEGVYTCDELFPGLTTLNCSDETDNNVEVCNGLDDNCNGVVDDSPVDANACGTCGPVPTDICDGLDNNCDGTTDESFPTACAPDITWACITGTHVECACCNGLDDDFDGAIDNDDSDCLREGWDCHGISTTGDPSDRVAPAVWTGSEMIVWGGRDSSRELGDGKRYNPAEDAWTSMSSTDAPTPRGEYSLIWTGTEAIVWGGNASTGARYNPTANTWTATTTVGAPAGRGDPSVIWTGSEMVVWGGGAATAPYIFQTGGVYDPSTDYWFATSLTTAPEGRALHTAVWTGYEMIVWGGLAACCGDIGNGSRYRPDSNDWRPISDVGAPAARHYHGAVWTGSEMLIWGGQGGGFYVSGGRYDPVGDRWSSMTPPADLAGRPGFSTIWTGSEMVVWGGMGQADFGPFYYNDGARYSPVADSWILLDNQDAPAPRGWHSAVWTGLEMLVWGGDTSGGGRYRLP